MLALGNIASRVLGMVRDIAVSGLFGASRATDAYYVATLVPRTLYDLMIGGQFNGAIIPVLSEVVTKEGQKALWQLVSVLLSLVTAVLALLVLVLIAVRAAGGRAGRPRLRCADAGARHRTAAPDRPGADLPEPVRRAQRRALRAALVHAARRWRARSSTAASSSA